jgi:hypothetical protein
MLKDQTLVILTRNALEQDNVLLGLTVKEKTRANIA